MNTFQQSIRIVCLNLLMEIFLCIQVKWRVYAHYLRSIGLVLSVATIILNMIFQVSQSSQGILHDLPLILIDSIYLDS